MSVWNGLSRYRAHQFGIILIGSTALLSLVISSFPKPIVIIFNITLIYKSNIYPISVIVTNSEAPKPIVIIFNITLISKSNTYPISVIVTNYADL